MVCVSLVSKGWVGFEVTCDMKYPLVLTLEAVFVLLLILLCYFKRFFYCLLSDILSILLYVNEGRLHLNKL